MAVALYKYLPYQYAELLLASGEVKFRSLSYFLACEHDERGDGLEGTHVYEPATGLDLIVMHKPQRFADQCEYRFAFSTRADAFEFENVNLTLAHGQPARFPIANYPCMLLKLGPMNDCCRIHRF